MKYRKNSFTLLEVMVAFAILFLAAASIGGWKMHKVIEKKRFQTDVVKIHSRLLSYHRLAMNMQADWRAILERKGKGWVLKATCIDQPAVRELPPLTLHSFSTFLNGDQKEQVVIEFSATGEVKPLGTLLLVREEQKEGLEIPGIFHKEESGLKKRELGPLRP